MLNQAVSYISGLCYEYREIEQVVNRAFDCYENPRAITISTKTTGILTRDVISVLHERFTPLLNIQIRTEITGRL